MDTVCVHIVVKEDLTFHSVFIQFETGAYSEVQAVFKLIFLPLLTKCCNYKPVSPCLASFIFLKWVPFTTNLLIGFGCDPKGSCVKAGVPSWYSLNS